MSENFRSQGKFYQTLRLRIICLEEINNYLQDNIGAEGVT